VVGIVLFQSLNGVVIGALGTSWIVQLQKGWELSICWYGNYAPYEQGSGV